MSPGSLLLPFSELVLSSLSRLFVRGGQDLGVHTLVAGECLPLFPAPPASLCHFSFLGGVDMLQICSTLKLGKIEGGMRRGQQRMRWLDGITDSMDMSLASPGRRAEIMKTELVQRRAAEAIQET